MAEEFLERHAQVQARADDQVDAVEGREMLEAGVRKRFDAAALRDVPEDPERDPAALALHDARADLDGYGVAVGRQDADVARQRARLAYRRLEDRAALLFLLRGVHLGVVPADDGLPRPPEKQLGLEVRVENDPRRNVEDEDRVVRGIEDRVIVLLGNLQRLKQPQFLLLPFRRERLSLEDELLLRLPLQPVARLNDLGGQGAEPGLDQVDLVAARGGRGRAPEHAARELPDVSGEPPRVQGDPEDDQRRDEDQGGGRDGAALATFGEDRSHHRIDFRRRYERGEHHHEIRGPQVEEGLAGEQIGPLDRRHCGAGGQRVAAAADDDPRRVALEQRHEARLAHGAL